MELHVELVWRFCGPSRGASVASEEAQCAGCSGADCCWAGCVYVCVLRLVGGSMGLVGGAEGDFAEYAALLSVVLHDLFVCSNK